MLDANSFWDALKAYYNTRGQQFVDARGRLLVFALHGKGRVGVQARAALSADGVTINRKRIGA